jgi:hypothetical protein
MPSDTLVTNEAPTVDNLAELLRQLSSSQMRFVTKRAWTDSDAEAAREIGLSPETVKAWKVKGAPIDEAVRMMKHDGVIMAAEMLRRALADAVEVKVNGLFDRDRRIAQDAATEIMDRNLGKPTQRSENTGTIQVVVKGAGPFGD